MAKKATSKGEITAVSATETANEQAMQLARQIKPFDSWLEVMKLRDEAHFVEADRALGAIKDLLKQAETERKELTAPLNKVVKTINARFAVVTDPLEKVEGFIKNSLMRPYILAKQAAAQKQAEKEAARQEKKGNEQFAIDIRAQAAEVTGIPSSATGLSTRGQWKAEIMDEVLLLQAMASDATLRAQINGDLIAFLTTKLSAMARVAKNADAAPAGVRFYEDLVIGKGV